MEDKTLKITTIHQCNCCMGSKTLHPLVSVIDLAKADLMDCNIVRFNFYTILLLENQPEDSIYGRQYYDFSNGAMVFLSPGQPVKMKEINPLTQKGWILVFHPDLLSGTSLGQNIKSYTFFSYHSNEALHLSARENQKVSECMDNVKQELQHAIDLYSKTLISKYIELLLDNCSRFYTRQFITRCKANKEILAKFEKILDLYFTTDQPQNSGLPSAEYCAGLLGLSSSYFEDLLIQETGKNTQEYIQFKRIAIARTLLVNTDEAISQIADRLGYPTPQFFCRLFKKIVGCTPNEYRQPN